VPPGDTGSTEAREEEEDPMIQWCVEKAARACAFAVLGLLLGSQA
jgi:hypothetical protein